jgi:hypothetical protein
MRYYCRFRGRGHSWHQVDAPSKKQAIQRFVRGSIVSPDEVLCQTNPPKGVSVVASGGQWYNRPSQSRNFGGKQYERFTGMPDKRLAESMAGSLRSNGYLVRVTTTKSPDLYYHIYVRKNQ